ncbi:g13180 [Coccomyxa viridis]|uniref:G13180 protein n=1 Tax=Coccomyxa viridis TaxID=1274662 RepID=A0ABP1GC48_9CHLO
MWSLKAELTPAATMAPSSQKGFFVSWEQVMAFFAMAEEALKAKTAANENLSRDAAAVKEELEEKRAAYIKVLRKEQAMSEDSAFLKGQMEALLKERSSFQEKLAILERENRFLMQERDIMGQQLQSEAVDGDDEADGACVSGLARSLRQRLEEERKRTEEAEAELDRQRASNAGLGASLSRLEAQLAAKKAFWEEKEASLLRSLEAANLAALQATRQALPQLPHPLALRSLLNGVMSGASAVRENLYDNVRSRGQRPPASEGEADSRSRPAAMRSDEGRGQSCYSSPSKASTPEPGARRSSSGSGGERPTSAKAKARRSPAPAPAVPGGHAGKCKTPRHRLCPSYCRLARSDQVSRSDSGHLKTTRVAEVLSKQYASCTADVPLRQLSPSPQQALPSSPS